MEERVPVAEVVETFEHYASLAEALGFEVRKGAVRDYALGQAQCPGDRKSFFSAEYARRHPGRTAPGSIQRALDELLADLLDKAKAGLNGHVPPSAGPDEIIRAVGSLGPAERARLAASVNGRHREFLRPAEVPIQVFHAALDDYAREQPIARTRLVAHLQEKLKERGVDLSAACIEERLRRNTAVRTVPAEMLEIVRNLDGSFRTGLAPIETMTGGQDPGAWLDEAVRTLRCRSKNALHKALAQATGVNYETVHKALTKPRPGQRLRVDVRDTLLDWLGRARRGEPVPLPQGEPVRHRSGGSAPHSILSRLEAQYACPETMYADAARVLGVDAATVRRAHEQQDASAFTPDEVLALKALLRSRKRARRDLSYLQDRHVRRTAAGLAARVERLRAALQRDPENVLLRRTFRRLRLQLIVAMKEGRTPETCPIEPDVDVEDIVPEDEFVEAL